MTKTPDLFSRDLPALPAGTAVRFHYADMADMPLWSAKPAGAWDDTAWDNWDTFRGGSMGNAIMLARQGWPGGAEQAMALHAGIQATVPVRPKLARYDVAGAVPSVSRAIAGNPMSMRRIVAKETAQRPIVSLVCDICVSSDFPADEMLKHAAAVASAVDFLEDAGFRCNVMVAARCVRHNRLAAEIAVQLKAPEQPLNLAVMAYGLGHPSFFRRLMFAVLQADKRCASLGSGLGYVSAVSAAPELGTFTIAAASRAGSRVMAPARFRWIMRALAQQGCPGIPEDMQDAA